MDSDLTLEKAKKAARQKEVVKDQHKQLQGGQGQEATLAGIGNKRSMGGARRGNHPITKKRRPHQVGTTNMGPANLNHSARDVVMVNILWISAQLKDASCHKCHNKGHFACNVS